MSDFRKPVGVASYRDLMTVKLTDNGEKFVNIVGHAEIKTWCNPRSPGMWDLIPGKLLVREGVAQRLEQASANLKRKRPDCSLLVTYGFRTAQIQAEYFMGAVAHLCEKKKADKAYYADPVELFNAAHMLSAYPPVAGHPKGAAVDLTIVDASGNHLDMGGEIADYDSPLEVFDTRVTAAQHDNRMLLRESMMEAGFQAFDLEWWHFMYGDAEWAYLSKKPQSLYTAKTLEEALAMVKA